MNNAEYLCPTCERHHEPTDHCEADRTTTSERRPAAGIASAPKIDTPTEYATLSNREDERMTTKSQIAGQQRKAAYSAGKIAYCDYCVETDDWDNHAAHDLYHEVDAEMRNDAHNVNIGNVGYCLTCKSTDATNGICGANA